MRGNSSDDRDILGARRADLFLMPDRLGRDSFNLAGGMKMAHMQHDITEKQYGWCVETKDAGTCFVPGDVTPVPDWLAKGVVIKLSDNVFDYLRPMIEDYVEGHNIESIEAILPHYFARLSAPGYMDCTEWCAFATLKEARDYLRDL